MDHLTFDSTPIWRQRQSIHQPAVQQEQFALMSLEPMALTVFRGKVEELSAQRPRAQQSQ